MALQANPLLTLIRPIMLFPKVDVLLRQLHRLACQRIVSQEGVNRLVDGGKRRDVLFGPALKHLRRAQVGGDEGWADGVDGNAFFDEDGACGADEADYAVFAGCVLGALRHVAIFLVRILT